jgi:hypothetical protein
MSAHNDHHHLHGERKQRPKPLTALESHAPRILADDNSQHEDDDDTQESDDCRIGESAFAPRGQCKAGARQASLRSYRFPL